MPVIYVNVNMGLAAQVIKKVDGETTTELAKVPVKDLVDTLAKLADENGIKDICMYGPKRFIAPFKQTLTEKGYNLVGKAK